MLPTTSPNTAITISLSLMRVLRIEIQPFPDGYCAYLSPILFQFNLYELFGKDRVHVYDFASLKKDSYSFVKNICEFIGAETPSFTNTPRNIGYSLWQLKVSRMANNLFKTELNPDGLIPLRYMWHPHRIIFQSRFFPKILRGKGVRMEDLHRMER